MTKTNGTRAKPLLLRNRWREFSTLHKAIKKRAEGLYNTFVSYQNDATSPYYNPYTKSTSKAVNELSNLGIDTSGGITQRWIQENSWLKDHYRMGTGNSPLAPTKKSSKEENAAYWYNRVLQDEPTTQQAETEWSALQEEITYWTKRTDRNYSDDEIAKKVNWDNYKTLSKLEIDRSEGLPTSLNRSIGYSQDALQGVIWAARNNADGDPMMNAIKAVRGEGQQWHEDEKY